MACLNPIYYIYNLRAEITVNIARKNNFYNAQNIINYKTALTNVHVLFRIKIGFAKRNCETYDCPSTATHDDYLTNLSLHVHQLPHTMII